MKNPGKAVEKSVKDEKCGPGCGQAHGRAAGASRTSCRTSMSSRACWAWNFGSLGCDPEKSPGFGGERCWGRVNRIVRDLPEDGP